ncbi:hypothetical protein GCM10023085_27580 [Actinomadura viridis]|uniref:DNA-binding SARP family transcriptional activator n=1 Tax=Actinomadura viridis TaxID=58110 RepID=A0A931DGR8_9ACTN|nr:AfsR/SARP family transcriptional regulator [Actinomadura viridis]MBG6087256.1 DNA-binding SARP family transcriptional activator [Actinomadura viridis]
MLKFRVLGPVDVCVDGVPVPLQATMLLRLLASLVSRPGRPVPVHVLVDALWGDEPPPSSRKTLQVYVRRLRQKIGEDARISHGAGGYALVVGPHEVDALQFARLVAHGRSARRRGDLEGASLQLGEALALWRGAAYTDITEVRHVADEARRLEEERLSVHEELAGVHLTLGRHGELIAELREQAAVHPYRERLHAALMLALYRLGRQAEALETYRRVRTTLRDELGVEPGTLLRQAHEAVLQGGDGAAVVAELLGPAAPVTRPEPARERERPPVMIWPSAPAPPAPVPCQLPPDLVDFTGRENECELIRRALAERPLPATATAIVTLAGPPGVGKTALAVHAAHDLRDRYPHGRLYADLRGSHCRPAGPAEVLAGFLMALGTAPHALPASTEARAALLRSVLADRRVLMVLDDAADERQLRPLLPGALNCGVLVTSRGVLGGLSAQRMRLAPFDSPTARLLLARIAGADRVAAEPAAAAEIVRLCGHLPLAVRIVGARLAVREHWSLRRLADALRPEHRRLDELAAADLSVQASLASAYQRLSPAGRQAFRMLGRLAGPEFTAMEPLAKAGAPPLAVRQTEHYLDMLVDAGLLSSPCGQPGERPLRYHVDDLVRLYARVQLDQDRPPPFVPSFLPQPRHNLAAVGPGDIRATGPIRHSEGDRNDSHVHQTR